MDMAKRAARLVRQGFAIFPLHSIDSETGSCTCGSPSCSSPAKHPISSLTPNGVKNASLELSDVQQWWALWPDANIAIATGEISDVVVVDVDNTDIWLHLQEKNESIPETWIAETGGGGFHIYFAYMNGLPNRVGMLPGIDLRSDGGYVVAPPSLHKSGGRYRWLKGQSPRSLQYPAVMPGWLEEIATGNKSGGGASRPLPEKITEGGRNDMLTSAAGVMRRKNFSFEATKAALLIENRLRCDPPLDDDEVVRIVKSVDRYPAERVPNITFGGRR